MRSRLSAGLVFLMLAAPSKAAPRADMEAVIEEYQADLSAAYMLGGLQLRALHKEAVDSGRMTEKAFHDAVLRGHAMPVEMVRAELLNLPLSRGFKPHWRFAGPLPDKH